MKMHLLVGAACLFALSAYAHAGPIHNQDGPNSMTKPNGDAGIIKGGPRKGTSLIPVLNARMPPRHPSGMAFCERRLPMAKLILLVALAFSITTGSITMMVLNPQPAMACPGNNGR